MTNEEVKELNKKVAGYKKASKAFLLQRKLRTRRECNVYVRDVATVLHHIIMADIYLDTRGWSGDQRAANLEYVIEHLSNWEEK